MIIYRGATDVRKDFLRIAAEADGADTIAVTKHGQPVLAVLPWSIHAAGRYRIIHRLETDSVLGVAIGLRKDG